MNRNSNLFLTALAPAIWGSTYLVTTEWLAGWHPLMVATLRALPAGLMLMLVVRAWPTGVWLPKILLLGALNFSLFWFLLFIAANRLPGGVAATVGAVQPILVILLARPILATPIRLVAVLAALAGMSGVALLVLAPNAQLDPVGIMAGLGGAVSMACGTVLSRRWQPSVSPLIFTAWQLKAGGIALLPFTIWLAPAPPEITGQNLLGLGYLALIGAAGTYYLWFRGIAKLDPSAVAPLGLLRPIVAVILGWAVLGQKLNAIQLFGMAVVVGSILLASRQPTVLAPRLSGDADT
ncbi:MAG: EamA family transporter [Luteolibacter sp.]